MLPEVILERKIALKALRRKALRLVRQKTTILGREDQAPATSRLSGSRAQAIPRHVTSRFGVALCFLNLPIIVFLLRIHGVILIYAILSFILPLVQKEVKFRMNK